MRPGNPRLRAVAQPLLLLAATAAAYCNTLAAPFLFDDSVNIVSNGAIRSLANFTSLGRLVDASSFPANLKYAAGVRPVAYLTFALNHALGGEGPAGFHLVNLAIHLANVLLVFALTRALLATPAFAASRGAEGGVTQFVGIEAWAPFLVALLFGLHPLQTEAVTYVTQRFASLAALFYLGAVLLHVRGRLTGERPALRMAAWLLALLAAMTKEHAATLPAVLLLLEIVLFESPPWAAVRRVWPFLLAVAVIPALTFYVSHHIGTDSVQGAVARGQNVPHPLDYLLTQTTVLVMYLALLVWPANLNFDYDYPLYRTLSEPRVLGASALLVALAAGAGLLIVRARRRSSGALAMIGFGLLWFLITQGVESSIVPLADLVDEYRCYLPSIGFFWAVVFGTSVAVERLSARARRVAVAGLVIAGVLLGVATFRRNEVYRDEVSLWEDTVAKSPLKARPHTNLSVAYGRAGREEDSILQFQAAAVLNPDFRRAHGRLGVKQDEFDQTMRGMAGTFVKRHLSAGTAALERGDLERAESEFRAALRLDPGSADAHSDLAYVHVTRQQLEDAVRENREAARLAPERADILRNLGLALYWSGRRAESLEVLQRAAAIAPDDAELRKVIDEVSRER